MARHRAVIIGAGRIGAGYKWDQDLGYTHAGAYMALKDRVELVGFVDPDYVRGRVAAKKWGVPDYGDICAAFDDLDPEIVSICTHPEQQISVLDELSGYGCIKGLWVEKPWVSGEWSGVPIQVNYQRRADPTHQWLAKNATGVMSRLVVYGKDDETTRCHFRDLSRFWGNVPLDYRPFNGPCAYILEGAGSRWFDNGGVNSAECFKGMLANLLDAVEGKAELWSPPYVERK